MISRTSTSLAELVWRSSSALRNSSYIRTSARPLSNGQTKIPKRNICVGAFCAPSIALQAHRNFLLRQSTILQSYYFQVFSPSGTSFTLFSVRLIQSFFSVSFIPFTISLSLACHTYKFLTSPCHHLCSTRTQLLSIP